MATNANTLVMIVEDNPLIAEFTAGHLTAAGYDTTVAESGEQGLQMLERIEPKLIVLDVVLGGMDGYEFCRTLRAGATTQLQRHAGVPVLMLTARAEEADRIDGFAAGVDDYVIKPFNPVELCHRVGAILRRATGSGLLSLTVGEISIDLMQRVAQVGQDVLDLSPKEFDLLHVLASNHGKVLPRSTLLQRVWGYTYDGNTRTVDVHVQRLREKLALFSAAGAIETEWGVGYKMVA